MAVIIVEEDGDFLSMREIQFQAVNLAVRAANGNHTKAAKLLEISRSTLYRLLKEMLEEVEPPAEISVQKAAKVKVTLVAEFKEAA